jgi:electron transfer flavoprotein beta subunit
MNIFVCIKQVPNTTEVKWDIEKGTLIREGVESIVNPFDLYAVEEGLRIKEKIGGDTKVIAMTMGPPQAKEALRDVIAMGVDEGILVSDRAFAGADTLATSYSLYKAIEKIGNIGIIIAGKQAIDGDTGQVGPGIASWFNYPQITYVRKIVEIRDEKIVVERLTDYGYDIIETELPVVLTVVKEINEPRLPSLRGKMKAKKFEPTVFTANDINADENKIGLQGSPTQVKKVFSPPKKEGGEKFEGEAEELSEIFFGKLKELKII